MEGTVGLSANLERARRAPVAGVLLLASILLGGHAAAPLLGQDGGVGPPALPPEEISQPAGGHVEGIDPEVRRLIRRFLTGSGPEQKAAAQALRGMGVQAVPDLRVWLRGVRREAERVERVLQAIIDELAPGALPDEPLSREMTVALYFERKLAEAEGLLRHGRYQAARTTAEAVLQLDPSSPLRFLLRRVIRQATEQDLREKLEPSIDLGALVYEIGEEPRAVFRLRNMSSKRSRIEIRDGIFGELIVRWERHFAGGNGKVDESIMPLRLREKELSFVLEPGQRWEYEIPFAFPKDVPLSDIVMRVRFQATFRPTFWELAGEPEGNIPLRTRETEIWVTPPGKKRKLEDPLKRLTMALLFRRGEDLLVAGWFCVWGGESDAELNGKLIDRLVESLPALDPEFHTLAHELLRTATGMDFKSPELWAAWWAAARGDRRAAAPEPPEPPEPPGPAADLPVIPDAPDPEGSAPPGSPAAAAEESHRAR